MNFASQGRTSGEGRREATTHSLEQDSDRLVWEAHGLLRWRLVDCGLAHASRGL